MNTHNCHRNTESPKQATDNLVRTTALERSVMHYWRGWGLKLVLRAQTHSQFMKWYKTFIWLFGSHDNPLTRQ